MMGFHLLRIGRSDRGLRTGTLRVYNLGLNGDGKRTNELVKGKLAFLK